MNEAAEKQEIPCAVCRDLLPLVQDGVANPVSEALVKAHLAACPACRVLQQGGDEPLPLEPPAPDDGKILQKLRRRYSVHLLLLAFVGVAVGMLLGLGGNSNAILLFLPFVCAGITCRDPGMWKPLLLFTLGLVVLHQTFMQVMVMQQFSLVMLLENVMAESLFCCVLDGIGCLIGWLLHYAKEEPHENE